MTRLTFHLLRVGHCKHPECVAMRGGSWRSVEFPALCGLMLHPVRGWMLFDTGYSDHFLQATDRLPEKIYRWVTPYTLPPGQTLYAQLEALGIRPADIACVLISHLHGDHIAGLKDFPRARFIALRAEYDSMRARSRIGGLMHAFLPALLPADFTDRVDFADDLPALRLQSELAPFDSGFDLFGDRSVIAIPLPGHSRGQMGIAFRGQDDRLIFMVADACWTRKALADGQGPTWLASRIFDSGAAYARTFSDLRQLAARAQGPMLVPSHCETSWKALRNEPA